MPKGIGYGRSKKPSKQPKSKKSQARIQQMGGKGNLTQKNKTR